jgi:hypothetical protein
MDSNFIVHSPRNGTWAWDSSAVILSIIVLSLKLILRKFSEGKTCDFRHNLERYQKIEITNIQYYVIPLLHIYLISKLSNCEYVHS